MSQRVPILVYHHVYPDGDPRLSEPAPDKATGTIEESELRRHLSYIAGNGWKVVNTGQVVDWLAGLGFCPRGLWCCTSTMAGSTPARHPCPSCARWG